MSKKSEQRQIDLVEAFTELGPAWTRWVHACLPSDSVSYARLRLLSALECEDNQTMRHLADVLCVTPRRVTALVDALEAEGLVERHPHPTDGRSTLITITPAGVKHETADGRLHQSEVGIAFGDLTVEQQEQLLQISRDLTEAFRNRLAERSATNGSIAAPHGDA
jgi:DNA-binding MarR family transcriptional regulator